MIERATWFDKSHRSTPYRHRMYVALTLTSSTTMRMVHSVHGHTTNCRSNVQPSTSTSLAQLSEMMVWIAGYANGGTCISANLSHFTTLQPDRHIHDLVLRCFLLRHNSRICTGTSTKDSSFLRIRPNTVHLSTKRYHLHREAVASECSLCS